MPDWQDAIRRELLRHQQGTGSSEVTLQTLYDQCKERFYQISPKNDDPKARLKQELQNLSEEEGTGEIRFLDHDDRYEILDIDKTNIEAPILTDLQEDLLEQWRDVIAQHTDAEEFDLEYYDGETARELAREFIDNPTPSRFIQLWEILHSAKMGGQPTAIYEKFDGTDAELAEIIEDVLTADQFNSAWEDALGAKHSVWELYGILHIEDEPIINGSTISGLELFGYTTANTYQELKAAFEDFREHDYLPIVGHVSEVALNLEIDQVFNVIDKTDASSLEAEASDEIQDLYRATLQTRAVRNAGWKTIDKLMSIPGDAQIWQISPGRSHINLWPICTDRSLISLGWGGLGDLSTLTKEEQARLLKKNPGDHSVRSTYRFSHDIHPGDIIVAKGGRSRESYGIGVVTSEYYHSPEQGRRVFYDREEQHPNFVDVQWIVDFAEIVGGQYEIPALRGEFVQWTVEELRRKSTNKADYHTILASVITDEELSWSADDLMALVEMSDRQFSRRRELADFGELYQLLDDHDAYWVTQKNGDELDPPTNVDSGNAYLEATAGKKAGNTLKSVTSEDVVFHYYEQEVIGYSTVADEPIEVEEGTERKVQVPVHLNRFESPVSRLTIERALLSVDHNWDLPLLVQPGQEYISHIPQDFARRLTDIFAEALEKSPNRQEVDQSSKLETLVDPPSFDISTPDSLYFDDEDLLDQINAALNSGKHIIFTGPPGTGKSKLAKEVSREAAASASDHIDDWIFSTATAEWTAYDTVGGYMPATEQGDETLEFSPGQFLRCFRNNDGDLKNRWLIIDELNRSDIDKAFGQVFSVLSEDSVELPYERDSPIQIEWVDEDTDTGKRNQIAVDPDRYPVTPAWRLIGTMNTADKASLYEMSYAFMRRFNFIHVGGPDLFDENSNIRAWLLNPDAEVDNYARAWTEPGESTLFRETLADLNAKLAVLWANIHESKQVGPAIIEDIASYVAAYDGPVDEGLTNAVIATVFPQFEGMRPEEQKDAIRKLNKYRDYADQPSGGVADTAEDETESPESETEADDSATNPGLKMELLKETAEDMFGIEFNDDEDGT